MADLSFIQLNTDWNAEPNAPKPQVAARGDLVSVSFLQNPFAFEAEDGATGHLDFPGCAL